MPKERLCFTSNSKLCSNFILISLHKSQSHLFIAARFIWTDDAFLNNGLDLNEQTW